MKTRLAAFVLCAVSLPCFAFRVQYAEQYYRLYHTHFYQYPDDTLENIAYLEQALQADFCNPLYALARIVDKTEWERYRYLFSMHVNLRLVNLYLSLGVKYDKQAAYFYNAPWKRQNLESLEISEKVYKVAYGCWEAAKKWSEKAWGMRSTHLEPIENWEDENYRIQTGDLDYRDTIDRQMARLAKVRAEFQAMGPGTY